jgi:Carboxypeptidase regulatory-like domain
MNTSNSLLTFMALAACSSSVGLAATISGSAKDPAGAPLEGVFVQAQNTKTHMTYIVLSDSVGTYRLQNLPSGDYKLSTKMTGYHGDPSSGVMLTADQKATLDMTLQKSPVRWNEISIYQAGKLWPASPAKDKLFSTCFTCHGFQTRIATVPRDAESWRGRVVFMQVSMKFGLGDRLNDQQVDDVAAYLNRLFGETSVLPKSPEQMPEYKDTVRPISSKAMNITYVEYDMPSVNRMPFSAAPDKDGYFWIPNFGVVNKISRLDPKTGEMQDYTVPNIGTAAVHSAVPATDGSV